MDRLRRDDLERARAMSPGDKALLAFELMATGIALRRAGIRSRRPEATEAEVDAELHLWLLAPRAIAIPIAIPVE